MYTLITPVGSSRPTFRVGQSSTWKEISRLSGQRRKTIAFYSVGLFIAQIVSSFRQNVTLSDMIKWRGFRISLAALTLWLCISSLIVLPMISEGGSFAPMFFTVDLENYDPFDQTETDDDLFVLLITGVVIAGLVFSKSRIWVLPAQM